MKPIDELLAITADEVSASEELNVSPEFVRSWRPRRRHNSPMIEPGVEPSAGFIACALAILRRQRPAS